ncbi:MAG: DUF1330 domain-containing protein [Actinomycetota bacterium]
MGAFLIINYDIANQDAIEAYRAKGGEFLVVEGGGRPVAFTDETIDLDEGHGVGSSTVVIEYESVEAAKAAFFSDGYQAVVAERIDASRPMFAQIVPTL